MLTKPLISYRKRGNQYLASQHIKLHHLVTGQCVNKMDSKKLLESFKYGEKSYTEFCIKRLVDKTKVSSDVI